MGIDDSTYSRVVAWLKIVLPLLALILLSTMFLIARTVDPAQKLPFADVDVDEIAREQRIGAPNYNGVTEDGTAIALSAESASPEADDPEHVTGDKVHAEIELPNGEVIDITAGKIHLDYKNGAATLRDSVLIQSAAGYEMRTETLDVALNRTRVQSSSETLITGAIGRISANSFELTAQDEANTRYVLVFKGAVKLIYNPNE